MSPKVLICGYYGFGNTGDEAILSGMISSLCRVRPDLDITVLSGSPAETRKMHNVRALYIGRRFSGLSPIAAQAKSSDLFILGGGGLLQDRGVRVVPFWLSRVLIASLVGTPVMFYAQGVGPLKTTLAKTFVRIAANRAKLITVRDEASRELLMELGVKTAVHVTADPALGLAKPDADAGRRILDELNTPNDKPLVCLNLRPWPAANGAEEVLKKLLGVNEKLKAHLVFLSMQSGDEEIGRRLANQFPGRITVIPPQSPVCTAAVLANVDMLIAMRLHAVILGALTGAPFVGLAYDPKVTAFASRLGLSEYCISLEQDISVETLGSIIRRVWEQRQDLRKVISERVNTQRDLAMENAQLAVSLLDLAKCRRNEEV